MKRFVIVGTAGSCKDAPFGDPTAYIAGLNDGYMVKGGFPRADAWYDIHPPHHFHFAEEQHGQPQQIFAHQIPFGYYVRPQRHLDWLATQTIPVWLHPEHATLLPQSATWPQARPFPKADLEAHFGQYFGSTPAWMLAHAIVQGYRDIEVYGIHLSTESEYIDQRPNFEFLLGCLLGAGKRTMTVADGKRIYESPDGRLVLPVASPVLSAKFQYAFEPSPRRRADPLHFEMHKANVKKARREKALMERSFLVPFVTYEEPTKDGVMVTHRKLASTVAAEIRYYDAVLADLSDQLKMVTA